MAVVITKGAFCGRSNMGEDQRRGRLGGYPLQVDAVPSGDGRGEDAWLWPKLGIGIVAYAKTIA
jgi:hypothetical protein